MNNTNKYILIIVCCLLVSVIAKIGEKFLNRDSGDKITMSWTPESTKEMHTSMYNGLGDVFTDSDRRKIADCVLEKLKNKYPNGFDGFNKDSLEKQTELLGEDCTKGMTLHFKWSQKLINKLKEKATKASWFKSIKKENKDNFCNCYVDYLKEMHPNGIVKSLSQSDIDSAITYCKNEFKK
ncbi:MAG: hypothetical protein JWP44_161 [Mucilaginibacter sp.]|nr:hypothetical protein [Mucilaginibacter sp.]